MGLSLAQRLARRPAEEREAFLARQPEAVLDEMLRGEWWYVARPEQIPPEGDELVYLYLAGRGAGKSRSGSEWIVDRVLKHPYDRSGVPTEWLVVADTLADARTINAEGPSGILNVLHRRRVDHRYKQSPRPMVLFPDGAKIYLEGADDPDTGRGYNAAGVLCVARGEPVATARGPVPIERVVVGDMVRTSHGWSPVTSSRRTGRGVPVVEVVTTNGMVRLTKDHLVRVGDGWTPAGKLRPGDSLLTCLPEMDQLTQSVPWSAELSTTGGLQETTVVAVRPGGVSDVHDLTVEGAHSFCAGTGFIEVHNCDEMAKWIKPYETWYEGLLPALRADLVNDHPRAFVTTTPKPINLLIEWLARDDGTVHVITGSTFDNAANLSAHALRELKIRYAGTALGEQELYGKLLELAGGGLFRRMDIVKNRVPEVPTPIVSTVIGVDPNLTGEDAETGIVVIARTANNDQYVLADRTVPESGRAAALAIWRATAEFAADLVVYEENLGKRYLQEVLQDAYAECVELGMFPRGSSPPMKPVHAKHGKKTRAEPVAMRNEQGRLCMVGEWPELENQMVLFDPNSTRESPDRMDALVHASIHLMAGEKRKMRISDPSRYDFRLDQSMYDLGKLM